MSLTIEATYENGVLKLSQPLPFQEREKVRVTVEPATSWVERTKGLIPCSDPKVIEWAALDPELDFAPPPEGT